jgi:hypothetical protein
VGIYLSAMGVLTLVALLLSKETRDVDYDHSGVGAREQIAEAEAEVASL